MRALFHRISRLKDEGLFSFSSGITSKGLWSPLTVADYGLDGVGAITHREGKTFFDGTSRLKVEELFSFSCSVTSKGFQIPSTVADCGLNRAEPSPRREGVGLFP